MQETGLIPESERFPGVGIGKSLQYSYLENPMDGGAWWAIVGSRPLDAHTHTQGWLVSAA